MTVIKTASPETIDEAAQRLRGGELAVLPTETVYGLGADATNGAAVAKIFAAKNRPSFNPLIVHVADIAAAEKLGVFDARARNVAKIFWPGPLTIIVRKAESCPVHDLVTAGLDTIAIRVPAHPVMRDVLRAANIPVAAPSANASGEPSATTPEHALQSLGGNVSFILAAGACEVGLESTVLDMTGAVPTILRPGAVTKEDLEEFFERVDVDLGGHDAPKSPGQLLKHYAPSIPVRLRAVDVAPDEALLAFGSTKFMGIKGGGFAKDLGDHAFRNLSEGGDLNEAAANLFSMLRTLDDPRNAGIAVMDIPDTGLGAAINDRLSRAAQGR
jgi:L-threonylcarbamoyladenylate synthase